MPLIPFKEAVNDLVYLLDTTVNVREMALYDTHPFLLLRGHIEAIDGFDHIRGFLLQRTPQQGKALFRVYGICLQQIILNGGGGFAEHIRNNSIQRQVTHSESVLKTVLLTGTHGYELAAVSGKFAKNTDVLDGNVTARNKAHTEQIADPFGILLVILIALHSGDPFGIREAYMDVPLKDVPDRDPILAGTLHTDIFAVVVEQSLFESDKAAVEGREPFLMVVRNDSIACDDRGDEKGFVNIDATADGVSELHAAPPSKLRERQ